MPDQVRQQGGLLYGRVLEPRHLDSQPTEPGVLGTTLNRLGQRRIVQAITDGVQSRRDQRQVQTAVKRARFLALLPYVGE